MIYHDAYMSYDVYKSWQSNSTSLTMRLGSLGVLEVGVISDVICLTIIETSPNLTRGQFAA